MKTKLPVIAIFAILVSACTTGTYMTKSYDDDIYFSPADVPPVTILEGEAPGNEKSARISNSDARNQRIIMSQMDKNADGTLSVENNIYQPEQQNSDMQSYQMEDQELVDSDTTVYYNDDDVKYVINNYYDDNDLDFTYRINRFHRPFWGSSFFYDDWYYGYYSPYYSGYFGGYGWGGYGWDPWYSGGWGYPYSYYGYYSPYSFGFGGYWGGYGGYSGYYGGYNNGYFGGGGGSFYSNHEVARRRPTNMNVPNGGSNNNNNNVSLGGRPNSLKIGNTETQTGDPNSNRNSWVENGHVRSRTIDATGNTQQDTKNATIVNNRRTSTNTKVGQIQGERNSQNQQIVRPGTTVSGNARRSYEPSTTGKTYNQGRAVTQSQNYTPSYNKPRIVNQSNYNNNSYTRPITSEPGSSRSAVRSSSSGGSGSTYSQPRSSSSMRQTYQSSSSYSNGSSSSSGRSYSGPSGSSSSGSDSHSRSTYSPPPSSSSSGGGGGYSGGSSSGSSSGGSSGSSSGGGGGSGHRR